MRLIRLPEVLSRTGVTAMTIWRWERAGKFPRRVRIGANTVAWPEDEVMGWQATKIAERDQKTEARRSAES